MRLSAVLISAAALAATAISSPSLAQPATGLSVSAQPASPADAARLELARQLFDLSGGADAAKAQLKAMFGAANKIVAANMPADRAQLTSAIYQDMTDEMASLVPTMMDDGARAFADKLTEQELRDYVAWLSSDSGRAVIAKMPAIRQEIIDLELPALSAMLPKLVSRITNRACEEMHCSAADQQLVAAAVTKALSGQKS